MYEEAIGLADKCCAYLESAEQKATPIDEYNSVDNF
jgi:exonuclease VII small subunit